MKRKMLISAFFIIVGGHIYAQEKSSGISKGSSGGGSGRRAISQKGHFKQKDPTSTDGNGTNYLRGRRRRLLKSEGDGFSQRGSFYRKKKENQGFASNSYRYKPNRRKGIR